MVIQKFRFIFLGYIFSITNLLMPMQSLIQRKPTTSKGLQHVAAAQPSLADSKRKQEDEGAALNPIANCSNPVLHAQERSLYAALIKRLRDNDIEIPHELGRIVLDYLPLLMEWNVADIRKPTVRGADQFSHWIIALTQVSDHEVSFRGEGNSLHVHAIEGATHHQLKKHATKITSMAILPHGDLVSAEDGSGTLVQWDTQTKKMRRSFGDQHNKGISSIALLPEGDVITGDLQGFARVWDMSPDNEKSKAEKKSKKIFDEPINNVVSSIVVLGNRVAMRDVNKRYIKIWVLNDDTLHRPLEDHSDAVSSLVGLPNNDLASGDRQGNIFIWDVVSRTVKMRFKHSTHIDCLLALSDGNLVASSNNGVMILWEIAKKSQKWKVQEHSAYPDKLAVTRDGDLVSGSMCGVDNKIIIWDMEKGTLKCRLNPPEVEKAASVGVSSLLVMKDGTIVAGFSNGALKKWHQTPCQACRKAAISKHIAHPSSK